MFCKKIPKEYPPGTFIPTPARVMAILHLCLVFTVLVWIAGYPFTGKLYEIKSRLLVYDQVLGNHYFSLVPEKQKHEILIAQDVLQQQLKQSFKHKAIDSLRGLMNIPITQQAWLILSIAIPILLLKRVEGSVQAVWLLPLAMLALTIDNRWHGQEGSSPKDAALFPTEEYLINAYIKKPLSSNILEQHAQLKEGWDKYLVYEWASETPSQDLGILQKQLNKGNFEFHLARLHLMDKMPQQEPNIKKSYYFLGLALFWNLSFALIANRTLRKQKHHSDTCKITG